MEPKPVVAAAAAAATPPGTGAAATAPTVRGLSVTPLTQCAHWHSARDVVAIRHACCGEYYACVDCHTTLTADAHAPRVWPRAEHANVRAVLCGRCRRELTVAEYLACGSACPGCRAEFNPGCARHYHLYFEM